jgi:hypothetical protein
MRDFNHTVNVLVQAFLNETLVHKKCSACAVGNIIIGNGINLYDNMGAPEQFLETSWLRFIKRNQKRDYEGYRPEHEQPARIQIESTGYEWFELAKIESAFESAGINSEPEEKMFNSLMAVVDVLAEIHGIDLTAKEEAKKLFVKA